MRKWEAPSEGTWHLNAAPDAPPHRFEVCDEVLCFGSNRRGWMGWYSKGATADLDDDPTRNVPGAPPVL